MTETTKGFVVVEVSGPEFEIGQEVEMADGAIGRVNQIHGNYAIIEIRPW